MRSLVVLCLLALARPASADEAARRVAAITAMFAAQTASFRTYDRDDKAFKATLTPDALVAFDRDYPRPDFGRWNVVSASKVVVVASQAGWAGTWGWLAAELRITYTWYAEPEGAGDPHPKPETHTYHWLALVVPDGAGVKTRALRLVEAKADRELVDSDYAQVLVPTASPPAHLALLTQPKALAARLASDPATSVLGTGPGERGLGAAAARRLVKGWSRLTLEAVDPPADQDASFYQPVELTVGDASIVWGRLRMKLPGKPRWYPIDAFAVLRTVGDHLEIVALMYGAE
jgi:hypothetical protein